MTEVIEALLYAFKTLMDHSEKCSKLSKENKFQSKLSFAVECRLHLPTLQPRTFITFVQHLISNFTSMFMNQLPRQKKSVVHSLNEWSRTLVRKSPKLVR